MQQTEGNRSVYLQVAQLHISPTLAHKLLRQFHQLVSESQKQAGTAETFSEASYMANQIVCIIQYFVSLFKKYLSPPEMIHYKINHFKMVK